MPSSMERSWPPGERIPPTVLREEADPPSSSAREPVDRRCWRGSRRCQACSSEKLWLGADDERRADSKGLAADKDVGRGTDVPMGAPTLRREGRGQQREEGGALCLDGLCVPQSGGWQGWWRRGKVSVVAHHLIRGHSHHGIGRLRLVKAWPSQRLRHEQVIQVDIIKVHVLSGIESKRVASQKVIHR
ncbi:hypothetical protein E2C01_013529 [Portunus trituberculatus]|uniref:Uncharacterized protein n=1 Tax=Portunus trituberculatus TaxID=210409 RepID=A0A5B7DHC2_PORTR|nr:hypothetical protein [Portunus trituberculatus]